MSSEYATHADRASSTADPDVRPADPGKAARTAALPASRGGTVQLLRSGSTPAPAIGKSDDPFGLHLVQQKAGGESGMTDDQVVETAQAGVAGPGSSLPHLDAIQSSFGRHDVSGVSSHVGGAGGEAATSMGALAYATGNSVAFQSAPDLHTAAHEAAHVVQQRAGVSFKGVGQVGDAYERHADEVADAVVQGKSAEGLLDTMAGGGGAVQQKSDSVQKITDEALNARADGAASAEASSEAGGETAATDSPDVFISYVKLAALPDWMPEIASHAFISFGDGWSAGFTMLDGEEKTSARVHIPEPRAGDAGVHKVEARRKSDRVSRSKTSAQIKQQIRTYAETVSAGRYNLITNNCGDWVKRALGQAWLVPETPGYVY